MFSSRRNRKKSPASQASASRNYKFGSTHLSLEQLESRVVLSVNPVLTVANDFTVDEGTSFNITNIGAFTDEVVGSGGSSVGLNPDDYTSLGAFDPATSVVFDTDSLTVSGFASTGTAVTANVASPGDASFDYEIAVFTFDSFELDAGVTITATGSRPLAILSQSDLDVSGTIDVSANLRIAGPGGGDGGDSVNATTLADLHGSPAAGAPTSPAPFGIGFSSSSARGGGGGAFGGDGGDALSTLQPGGTAYGDLEVGIQGGSGAGAVLVNSSLRFDGGGGGGGIELGASGAINISGSVLADGGDGALASLRNSGGGGGGGILVHAFDVTVSGTLSAEGGDADVAPTSSTLGNEGGGGGGGRILLSHDSSGIFDTTGSSISVATGLAGLTVTTGQDGVYSVVPVTSSAVIETYDYVINWGDGSPDDIGIPDIDVLGSPGVDNEGSFDGGHSYADNDVYEVTVTVNDSGGGTATDSFFITVENVDPTITADLASLAINEGQTATNSGTFSDVPADVVTLTSSLGVVTDEGGGLWSWSFDGQDDLATTVVTITATDDDGGTSDVTFDLSVANVDPVLTNVTTDSTAIGGAGEGDTVTLSADFTDLGLLDTHTATIDWGDGTTTAGVVDQGAGTVSGDHVYADGGIYDVVVTLTDDDAGQDAGNTSAVIAGVGLHDGVLQIIGTNDNDFAKVYKSWYSSNLKVLSYIGDGPLSWESFAAADVDEIEIVMGGGHDLAFISSRVHVDATLDGGDGDDLLFGGHGNDVLLGGAGYDVLIGRGGRDLMIGGAGSDYILGNSGEDILVAGTTAFDNDAAARDAIMAEWTSSNDYATRVANITNTGSGIDFDNRLNEEFFLVAEGEDATVFDDEAADLLVGGRGLDLYFANLDGGVEDCVGGLRCGEILEELEEVDV